MVYASVICLRPARASSTNPSRYSRSYFATSARYAAPRPDHDVTRVAGNLLGVVIGSGHGHDVKRYAECGGKARRLTPVRIVGGARPLRAELELNRTLGCGALSMRCCTYWDAVANNYSAASC